MRSFPQVQPDEAGPVLLHEFAYAAGRASGMRCCASACFFSSLPPNSAARPPPACDFFQSANFFLNSSFAEAVGRGDQGHRVADEEVELAVAIDVIDPDPRVARRAP